jgi:hypothetical protein
MSFTLNGNTFTPRSPYEHSMSQLSAMNSKLVSQGLPELEPNNGNALWWTLLAQGDFNAEFDQIVAQAANSLNVSSCDDIQLLNLLPIAGTSLLPATFTTCVFTAIAGSGICNIPVNTPIPYGVYNFLTASGVVIPVSGMTEIYAQLDTSGPIPIQAGVINLTTLSGISNLASLKNLESGISGSNQESVSQARNRIVTGKNIGVGIDGATQALRQLNGVGQAKIFMNILSSGNLPLPGLPGGIPPRMAYILIQGYNPLIAQTYLTYMNLPTSGIGLIPDNVQHYTTLAGQQFPVRYNYAGSQEFFVKVVIDTSKNIDNGYSDTLKNSVLALNGTFGIGERVSSDDISDSLYQYQSATILGAAVCLASGGTYANYVDVDTFNIPIINPSGILIYDEFGVRLV